MARWWSGAGQSRARRPGHILGCVEIDGQLGQGDGGDACRVAIEERARAFFAGEVGEGFEMFAEKQSGRTVASVVVSGGDAAAGRALGGGQVRDDFGGKGGLVAEGDEGAVEGA